MIILTKHRDNGLDIRKTNGSFITAICAKYLTEILRYEEKNQKDN